MEVNEYKNLFELENNYWWYVGRRSIIESILKRFVRGKKWKALDIGCGTGINLGILSRFASEVIGIDKYQWALDYCRQRGFNNLELMGVEGIVDKKDDSFGLVTLFDVLEHVENDTDALKNIHRILSPGGALVLTVPAYPFLWSEHDIALHHYRRYVRSGIVKKMEDAGFKIEKASYIIIFTFPVIVAYRLLKGLLNKFIPSTPKTSHVMLPKQINNLFIIPLKLEAKLINYIDFPFGTSIIVVGRKQAYNGQI